MKIIGIETSSIHGGVAALDIPTLAHHFKCRVKEITLKKGLIHGKSVVPALDRLLNKVKWRKDEIELIAVDIGPGSYTGLRVGLAIAKTISFFLNIKIIGVPSLDVLVDNLGGGAEADYHFICPVIDAKWNQVYTAIYERREIPDKREEKWKYKRCTDYLAISPEELVRLLTGYISRAKGKTLLFGDGLKSYQEVFKRLKDSPLFVFSPTEDLWFPKARNVAILGYKYYKEGKEDDPIKLLPMYLRKTEAEMNKAKSIESST
ncbi:MAG: tRNA (adenosine(37)-N6)-threonylcarbamoyltransferase complex dimerization subunit type 1 TsaB [Planctomycetota bacterium]|nr:tRNA (adenosine(37)-N6)-threonylcarbamoyltransferase complex dimerization subunit type 1 TsaB [Planctomycetota bacterium]MDI6787466.1 tRNA (adenosine(37)-N6)-threonylcarbamoyltransferase complex dimerization subunit type 1 TsaB [Planctomycetota bacterium]